jgi:hypothetical protein
MQVIAESGAQKQCALKQLVFTDNKHITNHDKAKKKRGIPTEGLRGRVNTCHEYSAVSDIGPKVDQACLVYQSALIGVKLAHFSGKSSKAKIAVTGQTGTHAPQSMHSTGLM